MPTFSSLQGQEFGILFEGGTKDTFKILDNKVFRKKYDLGKTKLMINIYI